MTPLIHISKGEQKLKNVSCSSNHQDKENYNCIINCNPDQSINANLNGAIGYPNNINKVIIILLSNENQGFYSIYSFQEIIFINIDQVMEYQIVY